MAGIDYGPDFAGFLHNTFGYPSKPQKAAIKYFKEKEENKEDWKIVPELKKVYEMKEHFGDLDDLHKNGLKKHYQDFNEYIIKNNLIGMVLYAADINNHTDEEQSPHNSVIQVYTTQNGANISLNVNKISQFLLKEYCDYWGDENKESEVDTLSKQAVNNLNNDNHRKSSPTMMDKLLNRKESKYTKKEVDEKREQLRKMCMKDINDGNEILVQGNGPYSYTINIDTADDETIMKLKSACN